MKIIALMGEAGSGKDTIATNLVHSFPNKFNEIVSCTTRPPREGEQNGINYHFLTHEDFYKKISNNKMLEWTDFNNWYYGTDKDSLTEDKINVGVFNPTGVRSLLKQEGIELKIYYVRASAKERLLRQLNREINPDVDEILRRASADKVDFKYLEDIPYEEILNEDKQLLDVVVKTIAEDNII